MFTGIITATADILDADKSKDGMKLVIKRPGSWDDIELGESIATSGVCLTVSEFNKDTYSVFLMPETLELTSFGKAVPKSVNLERSLRAGDRFGGHFVQGHVDSLGKVTAVQDTEDYRVEVEFPESFLNLVAKKGSITIDGVSLTIADCSKNRLTVALIPHTLERTTLSDLKAGSLVNLEFDVIAKHIAAMMQLHTSR